MPADSPAAPADILDDLLSPPVNATFPEQAALARLIRAAAPVSRAPAAMPPAARAKRAPAAPVRQEKVKTSQYFTAETHARLARAKKRLVRAERHKGLGRISQSRIVETAVRRALEEFEADGLASRLGRDLETTDAS